MDGEAAGIADGHRTLLGEEIGDRLGVIAVALDAQRQGLEPLE
jgi:hypothetical protein